MNVAFKIQNQLSVVHQAPKTLFEQLKSKNEKIAVVGLGYVGLPVALNMAKKFSVIGFDINHDKIECYQNGIDPTNEIATQEFQEKDIQFSHVNSVLNSAKFFIVAVPTPVNEKMEPSLTSMVLATQTVAKNLKKGDYVVFESTVYPGCTEEVCVPILESYSGLKYNEDFFVGYSPERINPGDTKNTFTSIKKIVSGSTPEALDVIAKTYESVVDAGIHKAPSLKVAEAAKIVENTQRDVNIALMNELSYIFDRVDISIHDVLEAAGTKWNFLKFFPGLVGGHCIGIDPYYLIHKSQSLGYEPQLIKSSRAVNEEMAKYIANKIIIELFKTGKQPKDLNVLVKGITFKENVKDIRNSKVADLIERLKMFKINIVLEDPYAEKEEVKKEYGLTLTNSDNLESNFDAIIMAVNHDTFQEMPDLALNNMLTEEGFVFDIRGTFGNLVSQDRYLTI